MKRTPTLVGLLLALIGPPTIALLTTRAFNTSSMVRANIVGQAAMWILAALVVAVILFWERLPLSTIGFARPRAQSIILGVTTAMFLSYVATPVGTWLVAYFSLQGLDAGLTRLRGLPLPQLLVGAITAGVVEELLYRGYAIERLSSLLGRPWLGALVALACFALAHLPFWGTASALFTFVAGGVLTLLYLWRRDLAVNMLAHSVTGVVQLSALASQYS
jgi:uncharacterized protein